MAILSPEFLQFLQTVLLLATIVGGFVGAYVAALRKVNEVKKSGEERSQTNTNNIATLQKELIEEREARKSAIASLEEWKTKYAASQEQVSKLEARITLQDREISDYKKAMNDFLAENQELRSQLEFERELRGALKQQTEMNGTFMTKAMETLERIVSPLIQSASQNVGGLKAEAQPAIPAKVEATPA